VDYLLKPVLDKTVPFIDLPNAQPFATGNGPDDYLCVKCCNVLLSKVEIPKPQCVMEVCGKCRTANLMEVGAEEQTVRSL
jgi:hypothetical protein